MSDALSKLKQAHRILGEMIEEMEDEDHRHEQTDCRLSNVLIGPCVKCGENFRTGQMVCHAPGGKHQHAICPRDERPRPAFRMPVPIPTSGQCAGCGGHFKIENPVPLNWQSERNVITPDGKRWHDRCAPKNEAQPIIPPWLRELEGSRKERWMPPSALVTPEEFALATQKVKDLEALAKLRAVVLIGNPDLFLPESVARHLAIEDSTERHYPSGDYRHDNGRWLMKMIHGLGNSTSYWLERDEILAAIDAAGAEIVK